MAWLMLASSLATLTTHRFVSLLLLFIAITIAAFTGIIHWQALLLLGFITAICIIHLYYSHISILKIGSEIILVSCAIGLLIHALPGFNNLKYLDKAFVGAQSASFTLYFNFDKALIPFILLACLPTLLVSKPVKNASRRQWLLLIIAVPVLLIIATFAGGLGVEFHLPTWLPAFVISNILFVSFAEEALFRGYLQQRLTQWSGSPYLALILTALLFGAAHFAGGPLLILFATLAGLIYGLAWMWSGKLWLAVSFHFGLNLVHLLFFTYPIKMVSGQ